MGRLINTTSMTIDGMIEVGDCFVVQGDHDGASRAMRLPVPRESTAVHSGPQRMAPNLAPS
jgi:hypothetical protein